MTTLSNKPEGYITLKEASELFGYAPDYIGQLIRKGKIEGKQVYANVAWMTTKDSLEEYQKREKGSERELALSLPEKIVRILVSDNVSVFTVWFLRALMVVLTLVLLVVFYFVSISIDHRLTLTAERHLQANTLQVQGVVNADNQSEHITYEK